MQVAGRLSVLHYRQLEERIDTLSKEARAHKSQAGAANLLISELKEELQQVLSVSTPVRVYWGKPLLNSDLFRVLINDFWITLNMSVSCHAQPGEHLW